VGADNVDTDTIFLSALCNPVIAIAPPPDLTGANSQYYHPDDRYAAYVSGQQVIFDQTLYQQGLIITPDGSETPWVYGTDWSVTESDIDTDTMTQAVAMLPSFSLTLLKSITILHAQADLPLFLNIASQSYYPRPENMPPLPDANNALTALLEGIIARITELENEVTRVTVTTSGSPGTPKLLAWDIDGTNSANLIATETYTVNTFGGQSTIRPIQGSFFKDSLVLSVNGQTLTAGTDYQAVGLNSAKTTRTKNASGIYDFILLTYDYAGPVQVTYHAVGGDASVEDLSAVYQNIQNVQAFLTNTGFLTSDQLVTSPAMQNIINKLCGLENQMRVLLSGTPDYGDSTNGVATKKFLRAPDTGLHWYTIAKLYQVLGSTDVVHKDRMDLHLQLVNALMMMDVSIAFDLDNTRDPLTVNARNIVQDVQFTSYGTLDTPANVTVPQFRVIWDAPSVYVSGAYLQIGLNLPNLTETLAIEDSSGMESCWILDTTTGSSGTPLTNNDTDLVLPDGSSAWGSSNSSATSAVKTMPNELGYLAWNGSQNLKTMDTTTGKQTLTNTLPAFFLIQDITEIVAELQDSTNNPMRVIFPMTGTSTTARRGIGMVFTGDGLLPVPMEVSLTVAAGVITLQAEVHVNIQTAPDILLKYLIVKIGNSAL
jgi:hypothetical protein